MRREAVALGVGLALAACGQVRYDEQVHGLAESGTRTASLGLATAKGDADPVRHPWPVDVLSIGHTIASYQFYGGVPYFHHGLDIRADAGSDVLAAAGGVVVNVENYVPGNDAYWEVAILDDRGFLWQYHHIEHDSIPEEVHAAFRARARLAVNAKLGEVYSWYTDALGERYHHIHLNVLANGDAYVDPFDHLVPLGDTQAPAFIAQGVLQNGRAVDATRVRGDYSLFAQVHDLIRHERFAVPPETITIAVDGGAPETVWEFNALPGGASNDTFVTGTGGYFVRNLTCGDYNCRKLTVDLGFQSSGRRLFPATPGPHRAELVAKDDAGNRTVSTLNWTVVE